MYFRNAILVGTLCYLVHQECRSQHLLSTPGRKVKRDQTDTTEEYSLSDTQIDWLTRRGAHSDLNAFLRSMSDEGLDPQAVMSRYQSESTLCIENYDDRISIRHPSNKRYNYSKYNRAVLAVSIEKFLSTAVEFCREAIQSSYEIVSVGCGDGDLEREVIAAYRKRYDNEMQITLVSPNHEVDYRVVPELIEKRPHVVGECALLIIWPEVPIKKDGYDIDAVRRLRPRTLLTLYELYGSTGSSDFLSFVRNDSYQLSTDKYGMMNKFDELSLNMNKPRDLNNYGVVDNYKMEEAVLEEYFCNRFVGSYVVRLVKLTRIN